MKRMTWQRCGAVLAFALIAGLTGTPHAANLVIGVATEATSLDPHFQDLGSNQEVRLHMFESLVAVGPTRELIPALAESWGPTGDPLVWEFRLRRNVRFHDGTPFTARDAVFSLKRAPAIPGAPSSMRRYLADIAEAAAVDDFTLRLRTDKPVPTLPNNLVPIGIVSAKHTAGKETWAFNDGSATIGTGPYKFVEFVRGSHLRFAANPDYWGDKPAWEAVTMRPLTNSGARVAALLAGDVDLIDSVPPADVPRLKKEQRVNIWEAESNRVILWTMDVERAETPWITAKDGSKIPNPLRDKRVRQALSLAIDRAALVDRVMDGIAIAANQLVPSGMAGHNPTLTPPRPDLARARALMGEAGYANGFKLTLHTTNDRYVNDAKLAQAVGQMIARLGIETTITALPVAVYFGQARDRVFTMPQIGWGHTTGDGYVVMREALRTKALNNYGNYSNPAVDALLDRAVQEMDLRARADALGQAMALAIDDVAVIPTHFQVNVWASKKGIRYQGRADELTVAMSADPQ